MDEPRYAIKASLDEAQAMKYALEDRIQKLEEILLAMSTKDPQHKSIVKSLDATRRAYVKF